MAVTVSDIKEKLPEFCSVDNQDVVLCLAQAEDCINRDAWGENRADMGVLYLTGHLLLLREKGSGLDAGPKTAESEGQISASYAASQGFTDSVYGATVYGRHYLELRRTAWPSRVI